MRINCAHIRHPAAVGGYIDFAVFDARSTSGTQSGNAEVLARLTMRAREQGLKIDQSALAFSEGGQVRFYGSSHLVEFLSNSGVPRWTHYLDDE
jgi:hypothetical protein